MLHEVLVELLGVPGGIFTESRDSKEGCLRPLLQQSDYLPFIYPNELALAHELVDLGNCYRILQGFVQRFSSPDHGIYIAAVACGLDNALDDYRLIICSIESDALSSSDVGLSHVCHRLSNYKYNLPVLTNIAQKIALAMRSNEPGNGSDTNINTWKKDSLYGCRILDVILSSSPRGSTSQSFLIRKLFNHTLRVLYRQLSSWLLYGILHDPYEEFFIKEISITVSSKNINGVGFELVEDRIPELLPRTYAEHILAIGEAVHSSSHGSSSSSFLKDLEHSFSTRFEVLLDSVEIIPVNRGGAYTNLEVKGLFDFLPLQRVVDDMLAYVSSRSWTYLVVEQDLVAFLRAVKDIMLLGRGELFVSFLDNLDDASNVINSSGGANVVCNILDRHAPSTDEEAKAAEYDITAAFLSAARSVGMDDEALDTNFKFKVSKCQPSLEAAVNSQSSTVWDQLQLSIVVPPAFRSVFSPQTCRGYSRLFSYLATIRRTQLVLQHCWAEQTSLGRRVYAAGQLNSSSNPNTADQLQEPACHFSLDNRLLIRNNMSFIVESLQYYLMVDVIETQFDYFIDRIQHDKQGQLIQTVQETFLATLQAQTLLFHPTAKPLILRLLSLCHRYVTLTSRHTATKQPHGSQSEEEHEILREFRQLSSSLFHCLSRSHSSGGKVGIGLEESSCTSDTSRRPSADLSQLLLRLDFNGFCSCTQGTMHPRISTQTKNK